MNAHFKLWGILAVSLLLAGGTAFAEMVHGQVTAVSQENQTLTLQRVKDTGELEKIEVSVPEQATFRGDISSLQEIEAGDEIRADANEPALGIGNWEANWVERSAQGAGAGAEQGQQGQGLEQQQAGEFGGQEMGGEQAGQQDPLAQEESPAY